MAGGFCYTYEYRPDGKLLKKWNNGKQVISCDYYKNGELKSLTDVSGKTAFYKYDENGRLSALQDEEGNNLTEYDYTAAGRIKEIRTSNGITTSYEYDGDGNISRLTIGNGTEEGLLYDAFMLYDLNGNRLKKQRYHYALTATGDMDSVIDGEESYCYNERNELTERRSLSAVTAYLYDENGSLIKEKEGEKETGYRYDLLNRQTHVQLPDGYVQENLYDGEGLRAGLKEGSTISTFLFYNGEILTECNGNSMPIRRHLRGIGLSRVEDISTGTGHTYHQDEQGSTVYVTGTTGGTENLYSYDGFGNILESREDIKNRILYTGQQYDQETGQYYLRARYYNPVIGRFTQEDTYRGDGLNLYAYCDNNPVMYYDPSGHGCEGTDAENTPQETPPVGEIDGIGEGGSGTDYYQDANGRWHRPNGQFASNAEVGGASESDHYLHRPYIRQGTIDAVNANTDVNYETGQIYDSISGKWVDPSNVELGHTSGNEFAYYRDSAESQGWTQSQFNDFMNNPDFYAWQDVYSNRSHKFEAKH